MTRVRNRTVASTGVCGSHASITLGHSACGENDPHVGTANSIFLASPVRNRLNRARAYIFDFYDTLVEDAISVPPMWKLVNQLGFSSTLSLQEAFEPNGFDGCCTPTFYTSPNHDDWFQSNLSRFLELSGVPIKDRVGVAQLLLSNQAAFRVRAVSGASRLVSLVKQSGKKVGLCSNWETPIEPYLAQARLPQFDAISISAAVGVRKPHALIFQDILNKLGVASSDAVFVGDNWHSDVVGALRTGCFPVWITRGHNDQQLSNVLLQIETLKQLHNLLLSMAEG